MAKSDANIKVGDDTTAFSKAIDGLEKGITEKLEKSAMFSWVRWD